MKLTCRELNRAMIWAIRLYRTDSLSELGSKKLFFKISPYDFCKNIVKKIF